MLNWHPFYESDNFHHLKKVPQFLNLKVHKTKEKSRRKRLKNVFLLDGRSFKAQIHYKCDLYRAQLFEIKAIRTKESDEEFFEERKIKEENT